MTASSATAENSAGALLFWHRWTRASLPHVGLTDDGIVVVLKDACGVWVGCCVGGVGGCDLLFWSRT